MVSSPGGLSRFAAALRSYGMDRCSLADGTDLRVGLPAAPDHRREALETVPPGLRTVRFLEAPEQADLVRAFAESAEAATVEALAIGTSHDFVRPGRAWSLDMTAAVAALRGASMPALTHLSLGDMEQLFNGHAYYGRLGDLTHVFDMAPELRSLYGFGWLELARPVGHDRLEALFLRADDIGVSGGPLSQQTIDHILTSRFPRLRTLDLALAEDNAEPYRLPDGFLSGDGFPALERVEIDLLTPDAAAAGRAWAAGRGVRWSA